MIKKPSNHLKYAPRTVVPRVSPAKSVALGERVFKVETITTDWEDVRPTLSKLKLGSETGTPSVRFLNVSLALGPHFHLWAHLRFFPVFPPTQLSWIQLNWGCPRVSSNSFPEATWAAATEGCVPRQAGPFPSALSGTGSGRLPTAAERICTGVARPVFCLLPSIIGENFPISAEYFTYSAEGSMPQTLTSCGVSCMPRSGLITLYGHHI